MYDLGSIDYEAAHKKAIHLRQTAHSYSEILKEIPVAKSTLSLWLRSIGLSKKQHQKLTQKRLHAARRGGEARRRIRLETTQTITQEASKDIVSLSKRDLWLMGVMLYWAEGSKEKEYRPGLGVQFTNSDPYMLKLFLKWLLEICEVNKDDIDFEIYVHESSRNRLHDVIRYWSRMLNQPKSIFGRIYFKKNQVKTNRRNIGAGYYGIVRIKVRKSSSLLRKIMGWVRGINKYYWGVV